MNAARGDRQSQNHVSNDADIPRTPQSPPAGSPFSGASRLPPAPKPHRQHLITEVRKVTTNSITPESGCGGLENNSVNE